MESMILIEELAPSTSNLIVESVTSTTDKQCWLNGIFMQAEVQNRNGRNYPLIEITQACQAAQAAITESGGIFGELDHPMGLNINLDRISHVITELYMDGTNAIGRAKILSTPMGNIARTLIESGARLGVSSRGAGNVNESGCVNQFNFITVDLVATPSAAGAMPSTIYESLSDHKRGSEIMSLAESVRHDPKAQEYLKREILNFMKTGLFAKK